MSAPGQGQRTRQGLCQNDVATAWSHLVIDWLLRRAGNRWRRSHCRRGVRGELGHAFRGLLHRTYEEWIQRHADEQSDHRMDNRQLISAEDDPEAVDDRYDGKPLVGQ